jgi:C4-dicarboxylate transporter DctQ subunit
MNQVLNQNSGGAAWSAILVKPLDMVTKVSLYGSCVALFLMLSSYVFEVIMRYFFNSPTSWSNDVIQLFFAAMIMLAVPEVTRLNGHIVISFFLDKMTASSLAKLERGIAFVGCIMCFFAAYICFQESLRQYQNNIEALWNTPIPKWWISGFIPYGFMLSGLQFLRTTLMGERK